MEINLIRATEKDAKLIHQMQVESFCELYLKYRDDETNPVNEYVMLFFHRLSFRKANRYKSPHFFENSGFDTQFFGAKTPYPAELRMLFMVNQNTNSWRKERDSNSRYGSPHTPFPGVRLQPLGHLSAFDWRREGDSNPRYAFTNV